MDTKYHGEGDDVSAVGEYRKWSEDTRDWTPTEGRIKADAAIAELEADHASVAKAYGERYSELIEARATIERLKIQRG